MGASTARCARISGGPRAARPSRAGCACRARCVRERAARISSPRCPWRGPSARRTVPRRTRPAPCRAARPRRGPPAPARAAWGPVPPAGRWWRLTASSEGQEGRAPVVQDQRLPAQPPDRLHVVRDEQEADAGRPHLVDARRALLLEEDVAHRERLVHDQQLRLQVREQREAQTHAHAGRVRTARGRSKKSPTSANSRICSTPPRAAAPRRCRPSRRALWCTFCRPVVVVEARPRLRAASRRWWPPSRTGPAPDQHAREQLQQRGLADPLGPMMPKHSPGATEKLISRSARVRVQVAPPPPEATRARGARETCRS